MHLLLNCSERWGCFCNAFQWSMWEGRSLINLFLTQKKIQGKPKGKAEVSIMWFFFFSASSSNMLKKNILCVISDDYIHKNQPRKIIPVLGIDHLQSKTYFMPLSWLPFLPWALGRRKKQHHSDCFMFSRCFLRENVFWALLNPWSRIWSFWESCEIRSLPGSREYVLKVQ